MEEEELLFLATATRSEDSKTYTVTITCEEGMSEQDFVDALKSFSDSLISGDSMGKEVGLQ